MSEYNPEVTEVVSASQQISVNNYLNFLKMPLRCVTFIILFALSFERMQQNVFP